MRSLGAFYEHQVLPRVIDRVCGVGEIGDLRARVAEWLHGDVLEIGFGSGLNQPHLPPTVRRVLAVDPAVTGRRLGARRLAASDIPVEFIGLDGEDIPLPDESVDSALSTFTLCTIPDVAGALREVHRVLRPGGQLHFLEHGLSPDVGVAKWQHRLTPLQRRIAGGCHFDRRIDEIVADAGFDIVTLGNHYLKGSPRTPGYLYEGVARKP